MILPSLDPRHVLPRWHSPEISARRAETDSLAVGSISARDAATPTDIKRRVAEFAAHRTDAYAGDLVSAALIAREPSAADEAARWLLDSPSSSALARDLARRVLEPQVPDEQQALEVPPDMSGTNREVAREHIRLLRARLALSPNDPMAWAELARQHTLTGNVEHALEAMRVAIAGAPNDRYLLRAAARLHEHVGDPERAHSLIAAAPRTPGDPWLVAAELSLADLASRTPRFAKAGRRLLSQGLPPRHLTELASVLGTMQLDAGDTRRARQLFRQALEGPNDNSLAQAEWAASRIGLDLDEQLKTVTSSWEARALAAAAARDSERAMSEAWGWFFDQPFVSEAAVFGSYHAAKARKFADGVSFAQQGVAANPDVFMLRNNLAFCLAKLDRVMDAMRELKIAVGHAQTPEDRATLYATQGLLAFRSGHPDDGATLYRQAIDTMPSADGKLLALINLAVEITRTDPESGEGVARQARNQAARTDAADVSGWLGHLA